MAKPKGAPKTGGRKKGALNKRTMLFSELLLAKGLDVIKEIKKAIDLENVDMVRALTDLIPYMAPRLAEREVDPIDSPENPEEPDLSNLTSEQLAKAIANAPK